MFFYIGGILAGFAIGYVAAIAQKKNRRNYKAYKNGMNDCRNCKYMRFIMKYGAVWCDKCFYIDDIPRSCSLYRRTDVEEGDDMKWKQ